MSVELRKESKSIQHMFNVFAGGYGLVDIMSLGLAAFTRRSLCKSLEWSGHRTVVDLMCGTGNNVRHIPRSGELRYTGIDFSEAMIKRALKKHGSKSGVRFVLSDVLALNGCRLKADVVLCSFGLKCITPQDYDAFAIKVKSLLNEGGVFALVEFQYPEKIFWRFLFRQYLNSVYRVACRISVGTAVPADALIACLETPLGISTLRSSFERYGLRVCISTSLGGSIIRLTAC